MISGFSGDSSSFCVSIGWCVLGNRLLLSRMMLCSVIGSWLFSVWVISFCVMVLFRL